MRTDDEGYAGEKEDLCARHVQLVVLKYVHETLRTFPRARRAPSKKRITPRSMKSPPKDVNATPISEFCALFSVFWLGNTHTYFVRL